MLKTTALRFALYAIAIFVATTVAFAQDDQERQKSFVLTRLGAINEGFLIDRGSSYLLEFEGGGSTMISKLDALYVGSSRESVFQYKASQTRMEDVNEVLKLADWASRRHLGAEAIKVLRHKYESSKDPAEQYALKRKIDDLVQEEAFRADAARAAEAAANRAQKARPAASSVKTQTQTPEDAELNEWAKPIPLPAIERFSRKAQPILQKRCSVADCHGAVSNSAYRVRPKALGPAARLALLHNLRETLDYVDFDDFEHSPLLNHPEIVDSKGERVYPFGNDRSSLKDCENFVEWINSLKTEPVLTEHAKATKRDRSGPRLRQGAASRYDVVNRNAHAPNDYAAQNAEDESFQTLFDSDDSPKPSNGTFGFGYSEEALKYMPKPEDDPNSQEAMLQRVGIKPKKVYRDEYDPAIFNDRFHQPQ